MTLEEAVNNDSALYYSRSVSKPRDLLGHASLKALCKSYSVDYELVRKRVYRDGWEILKALSTPARGRSHSNRSDLVSIYYEDLDREISYSTFTKRVYSGMTPEEALTAPNGSRKKAKRY